MTTYDYAEQEYMPQKKKLPSEDEKRKKKIVRGSLMKAIVRRGGGNSGPSDGDQIIYHCTIRTLDGVVVESTRSDIGGKGTPIRQVLGKSKMILGLLEGIPTMLKEEVAIFKMKPQLHYGNDDCPISPPDNFRKEDELHSEIVLIEFHKAKVPKGLEMGIGTMLKVEKAVIYVTRQYLTESPLMPVTDYEEVQFEVELVHFIQVRDILGDGRLIKRRIRDGTGEFPMDCPLHDSLLRVHYKGMLLNKEKTVFYDTRVDNDGQPLEFCSGERLLPEGFEMCVRLMLPREIALVTCPPDYAYDKFSRAANVPEGAHVQWEIELIGFEKPKDWTELDFKSIMDDAEKIRNTGDGLFKEGKIELAKAKYEKVLRDFNHVNPEDDAEEKVYVDTRNSLHLNVVACYLKLGEWTKSIETCNQVLEANPAHVKGLYRRGMAYMAAGDFEEARSDFKMMMKFDESTKPDAPAALQNLKQKELEAERKARKQFKGLFDKKPGEIAEPNTEDREFEMTKESQENTKQGDSDETNSEKSCEDTPDRNAHGMGWFSLVWSSSRRLFSCLWRQR